VEIATRESGTIKERETAVVPISGKTVKYTKATGKTVRFTVEDDLFTLVEMSTKASI